MHKYFYTPPTTKTETVFLKNQVDTLFKVGIVCSLFFFSIIAGIMVFSKILTKPRAGVVTAKPISFQTKQGTVAVASSMVSGSTGGELTNAPVEVKFPEGFSKKEVVASYQSANPRDIKASHQVGEMFSLLARATDDKKLIHQFDKPLTLTRVVSDEELKSVPDPKLLAFYYFDPNAKQWNQLQSSFDPVTHTLTGYTTHFTLFMVGSGNPNQGVVQPASLSMIVDDSDGDPRFIWQDLPDDKQESLKLHAGVGFNGDSIYTGNSITDYPHNAATWAVDSGLSGTVEVTVDIPAFPGLTHRATYVVTHAGGTTEVPVDQAANAGKIVSLGTFTFNGSGSVYLSDVVSERDYELESYIIFDAVSFGAPWNPDLDINPPIIEQVKAYGDNGVFYIQAKVTDDKSGVDSVVLYFNGSYYPMHNNGNIYSVAVNYPKGMKLDYKIIARDKAGNESIWDPVRGYQIRGRVGVGFPKNTKQYIVSAHACDKGPVCSPQEAPESSVYSEPLDTQSGNIIEQDNIIKVGGRPGIDLYLTYNALSGQESIFGQNWTESYGYHVYDFNNPDFTGAFVQFPDGHEVKFSGPTYTPEPGYYETLVKTGSGFELTFKDLSKVIFDSDGDITRWQDANGNGLVFTYGIKVPGTLMSQVTNMAADGGRQINLTYNDKGLVDTITGPEGKLIKFSYSDTDDLVSITDSRNKVTAFDYLDHNLMRKISPEGFTLVTNEYDDQRRVIKHVVGDTFGFNFTYGDHVTTAIDANSKQTTYTFNSLNQLQTISDAKGQLAHYEYTPNKEISAYIDKDGYRFEYTYDDKGNVKTIKDPLLGVVERTYDLTFNKPVHEKNVLTDHTTDWKYDAQGNLLAVINAKGSERDNTYDELGQLKTSSDFNGNTTTYTYTGFGDVKTITYPETNMTTYSYDGAGRVIEVANPRGKITHYVFDKNDNLIAINKPLGISNSFVYDGNNWLTDETDANTGTTHYVLDHVGSVLEIKDPMHFTTTFTYGLMNEKLSMKSPENQLTTYKYDDVYNLTEKHEGVGTDKEIVTHYEYDGRRNVTKVIDANNHPTVYKYDELGRLKAQIQNAIGGTNSVDTNVTTSYTYGPTGVMLTKTDGNGFTTNYKYDELDRLRLATDPENQTTEIDYDKQSNKKTVKNPRGFTTTYNYDKDNRLAEIIDARGGHTVYNYDGDDNVTGIKDANNITTAFNYDDVDRRIERLQNFVNGATPDSQTNVSTKYGYDLNGNLTSLTTPKGFATSFTYDADNRNTEITDPLSHIAYFTYDKVNRLVGTKDRNEHTKSYGYDPLNRMVISADEETHTESYGYDNVGNLTSLINRRGKLFKHDYDPLNRVKVDTDPYTKTKLYTYDANGNLLTLTDENGHTNTYSYDKVNRLRTATDAESIATKYEYDSNGNVVKKFDGEGNLTKYDYDELDRLISKINAENEQETYGYDKTSNMTSKVQGDGTVDQFNYDPLYRLAMVVNNFKSGQAPNNDTNVTTKYTYDADSNMVKTVDPLTHETSFSFDELDRLKQETNPLGKVWSYKYDPEGNLKERVDGKNVTTGYEYYPDNMLSKIVYPGRDVKYQYSETNFPTQMDDNLGTTTWTYDDLDRMISQKDPFNRPLGYEYDDVGNLKKLNYPDGRNVTHQYLKNDWLQQSADSDGDAVAYIRNKVGVPKLITRSNSSTSQITYDKVYRPKQVWDQQIDSGNHLISRFNYNYNKVGQITQETDEYGWRNPAKVVTTYLYDGLHRVASANSDDGHQYTYGYDAAGNRTLMMNQLKQGVESRNYTYDAANELTQVNVNSPMPPNVLSYIYSYDNNGNRIDKLIKDATGVDRGTRYSYDEENRLLRDQDYQTQLRSLTSTSSASDSATASSSATSNVAVASSSAQIAPPTNDKAHTDMQYDGNGRRLVSTYYPGSSSPGQRTEYSYDRLDPIVEYNMQNGQRNQMYRDSAQNLLAHQQFKSEKDPNGTLYWYHYDGEGNIAATTKQKAQSDHTYRYDPYGNILPDNGASGWTAPHNQYTLTQKQFDANTNLYYFGARYYDADVGVWLTQDTYHGIVYKPQTLHRYMYNFDSPMNYRDMYGYCSTQVLTDLGCSPWTDDFTFQKSLYSSGQRSSSPTNKYLNGFIGAYSTTNTMQANHINPKNTFNQTFTCPVFILGTTIESNSPLIFPYEQSVDLYSGTGINSHHLIEQRFSPQLGLDPDEMMSTPLERAEHQPYTNAWRDQIGYDTDNTPLKTSNASVDDIENAINNVYKNDPELKEAALEELKSSPGYTAAHPEELAVPELLPILLRIPWLIVPTDVLRQFMSPYQRSSVQS